MKKIALYIRVSTEEQAENPEGSLKSQEQRLREHVSRRNESESWGEIKGVFIERGKSGKDTNRPELQKMLLGIKSSLFELVLMTEISRLSRSTRDFCNMFDLFRSHNCQILSLREQFDTTTAAGEMMMHMLMNFAQFERQQTAERVKANSRARAKRGLYNGGISPLGYISDIQNKGRLLIVEEEAKVIKECFKTFLEKGSLVPAVQDLNKRGFSPKKIKVGSNKKYLRASYFTTDYLYRVLTNPVYIAKKRFVEDGKEHLVPAQWPAIIDEKTFCQ
ncbi:MAG: recombinase family protein [Deltaproteobacteria bacterium]|nr:recombinase family protein [Deltaproteobacteria bacterium]